MDRIISCILIIYFAFLSIRTCSEFEIESCEHEHETEQTMEITVTEHGHKDLCSPLCYCICCNSPVTVDSNQNDLTCIINNEFSLVIIQKENNLNKPSWQPPEII